MEPTTIKLEESWKSQLLDEFSKDYFLHLKQFLLEEKQKGAKVFPPGPQIFAALDRTPFHRVKVVLIGQDPYHGAGQANGLCFSVSRGLRQPPSLQNIFKELKTDLGIDGPQHGDLSSWAEQGVLLLNATLTVRASEPGSHQGKGWETFTDTIISILSARKEHLVFILWGKYAQGKASLIDSSKHCIIQSAHPSPYSASNGFFGSRPFSRTNAYLLSQNIEPVDFSIKD